MSAIQFAITLKYGEWNLHTIIVPSVNDKLRGAKIEILKTVTSKEQSTRDKYEFFTKVDDSLILIADPNKIAGIAFGQSQVRSWCRLGINIATTSGDIVSMQLSPEYKYTHHAEDSDGYNQYAIKSKEYLAKFIKHFGSKVSEI